MQIINSPSELMEAVNSFRLSKVILTAFELDIFTVLGSESKTAKEISELINADARATDRLMNVLAGCGLLEKKNNIFKNTPLSLKFLVKGNSSYLGGFGHTANLWHSWTTLTEAVKKGTTVIMKDPINERDSEWLEPFIAAMHQKGKKESHEIAELLDFTNVDKVLDLGGGSGAYSFAFIDKKPTMKAVVYDLPNVTPLTKKYIEKEGYNGKVETVEGNYLKDPLGKEYDMTFLSAVIHSNSPDETKSIFKKCAEAMNTGGQIVVLDHIMNEDRTSPLGGALFAINMLVGTDAGDTYTEREVKTWLKDADFGNITRKETSSGTSIMIGKLNQWIK